MRFIAVVVISAVVVLTGIRLATAEGPFSAADFSEGQPKFRILGADTKYRCLLSSAEGYFDPNANETIVFSQSRFVITFDFNQYKNSSGVTVTDFDRTGGKLWEVESGQKVSKQGGDMPGIKAKLFIDPPLADETGRNMNIVSQETPAPTSPPMKAYVYFRLRFTGRDRDFIVGGKVVELK